MIYIEYGDGDSKNYSEEYATELQEMLEQLKEEKRVKLTIEIPKKNVYACF